MADIRGVQLRKFKLRKIILGVRMHFRHSSRRYGCECDSECHLIIFLVVLRK